MAEMEKEGRPPENKRSRKPAHPVKREIKEEMKVATERAHPWAGKAGDLHGNPPYSMSFAENTMNELLGWYGYDKVELRDSDRLDIQSYPEGETPQHVSLLRDIQSYPDGETPQHVSLLKENPVPKVPASMENDDVSPNEANGSNSNGLTDPSGSTSGAKDHGNMPIMVPMIPPPLMKPPADDDLSSVQILCAWCQKVGVKRYSLSMGSELKSFCSEKCFAACRRAYFKRNKARDEDGLGEPFPQHSYAKDTPRLVYKTNSDVLVCDWCKHIRHTKEYLDFGAGERRLQFCSAKCLNQYKMDIFYKETQAALPGGLCNPGHGPAEDQSEGQLLTPESWGSTLTDLRRRAPSPGGAMPPPCRSSAASPSDTVCSPSSSSAPNPTPRPHESPASLPLPPVPALHPPMGGSPPMVMTPRGPVPLPLFMEHQMMQQMRPPPFLRPPHAAGARSPLSNPMIPGVGPPPPPMPPRPGSMPRPFLSPHMHPSSSTPSLPGRPPHPGLHMPPFPPVGMTPNGHLPPMPPMMHFGMPSLAPLVPPPTLLVPYPVIVPLPVPIPIPIPVPIPFPPRTPADPPGHSRPVPSAPEESAAHPDPRTLSPGRSGGGGGERKAGWPSVWGGALSPGWERGGADLGDLRVKAEESGGSSSPGSGLSLSSSLPEEEGVVDLTVGGRRRGRRVARGGAGSPGVQVKVEAEPELDSGPSPSLPPDSPGLRGRGHAAQGALDQEEGASEADAAGPPDSAPLPGGAVSSLQRDAAPPSSSSSTSSSSSPPPAPRPSQLPPPPRAEPGPAPTPAPWNVIVNGRAPEPAPPERRAGGGAEGAAARAGGGAEGALEREALKENSCSAAERDAGKRTAGGDEAGGGAREGGAGPDAGPEGEEHAYALLPLTPKAGSVLVLPLPKPRSDKAAIGAPLATAGSPELEPALKRRCLRIRNHNK